MDRGRIVQAGSPEEIYRRPRTRFVADFVGSSNVLPPELSARLGGAARWSSLRPEAVSLAEGPGRIGGRLRAVRYLGGTRRVAVVVEGGEISAVVDAAWPLPAEGERVALDWSADALHAMDED